MLHWTVLCETLNFEISFVNTFCCNNGKIQWINFSHKKIILSELNSTHIKSFNKMSLYNSWWPAGRCNGVWIGWSIMEFTWSFYRSLKGFIYFEENRIWRSLKAVMVIYLVKNQPWQHSKETIELGTCLCLDLKFKHLSVFLSIASLHKSHARVCWKQNKAKSFFTRSSSHDLNL